MQVIFVLFIIYVIYVFIQRYVPVYNTSYMGAFQNAQNAFTVIDLRDYIIAAHSPVKGAYEIPLAHLKRHTDQIPNNKIVVVASDPVEKNIGVRMLKRKGFDVVGFHYPEKNRGNIAGDLVEI